MESNFDIHKWQAKHLVKEGRTQSLYNLLEKIYDAGVEGTDYDENFGFSSIPFQDYWKENQAEIMQIFRQI